MDSCATIIETPRELTTKSRVDGYEVVAWQPMRRDECVVDGGDGKRTDKPVSIDRRLHGRVDFPMEKHDG